MFTLEVLDSILLILSKEPKDKKYFKYIEHLLYENLVFKNQLSTIIIEKSLEKLGSENYITKTTSVVFNDFLKEDLEETLYDITWEGHFFISNGGYSGQYYYRNEEKERIKQLEKEQLVISQRTVKTQEAQVFLSRVLVWLTAVASIYYIIEILNSLYSFLPSCQCQ